MSFLRTSCSKKVSTIILLVLFTFIHAVKAFHTHNFSYSVPTKNSNKNTASVKATFFCAICDFQIAKDSDAEVATLHISTPVYFIETHYNYTEASLTSFSIISSVRGPPAFA